MGILRASVISLLVLVGGWQEQNASTATTNTALTDEEIIREVVFLIRNCRGTEGRAYTEHRLREMIEQNPESAVLPILKALLESAEEKRADHHFRVAMFCLIKRNPYEVAALRLEHLVSKYPRYSRLDEAIYQLGIIKLRMGLLDEAEANFNLIIKEHSSSLRAKDARRRIKKLTAGR